MWETLRESSEVLEKGPWAFIKEPSKDNGHETVPDRGYRARVPYAGASKHDRIETINKARETSTANTNVNVQPEAEDSLRTKGKGQTKEA